MTRPTDPRGASRRAPSTFGAETGLDVANDAPARPREHSSDQPHRPKPQDHGCHGYELHGIMYTRCPAHRPAGSTDAGPVRGQCVACSTGG